MRIQTTELMIILKAIAIQDLVLQLMRVPLQNKLLAPRNTEITIIQNRLEALGFDGVNFPAFYLLLRIIDQGVSNFSIL